MIKILIIHIIQTFYIIQENVWTNKNTEDFYIIHYGKIDPRYISGEKSKMAEIYGRWGSMEERLRHHKLCRTGAGPNGPEYVKCPKDWFWN